MRNSGARSRVVAYGSVGNLDMSSDRGRESLRSKDDRLEEMVKSSRRYLGWQNCREFIG